MHVAPSVAEEKCFFSKQAFFDEGEQMGRLLAKLVCAKTTTPVEAALHTQNGKLLNMPDEVMRELVHLYSALYQS